MWPVRGNVSCQRGDGGGIEEGTARSASVQGHRPREGQEFLGAAFWALAQYALGKGGVVYGACFDDEFRIVQRRCVTEGEAQACRGSKYSQGFTGTTYGEVYEDLRQGRCVLYTGTPCQIAGLRSFLSKKSYSGQLVTCDLICHGTPSNRLFREYIAFLERKSGKKVIGYCHRPKDRVGGFMLRRRPWKMAARSTIRLRAIRGETSSTATMAELLLLPLPLHRYSQGCRFHSR